MGKEKIFVSAYACEPDKGSEIGVGWHWILEMSKQFDLWVLTRKSNKNNIQEWIKKNPQYTNIQFLYYDLPKWLSWWKKGLRGVRTYYVLWQKFTNKIVRQIMIRENIRIYHLLTYGNALWPASTYGMKQFFIWGPTGGTDTIPYEFLKHYGVKAQIIELVRHMVVNTLPLNYGFQKRIKNANIILCKSDFMYENISQKYKEKAIVFTDVAVNEESLDEGEINCVQSVEEKIKYLAVGRLDAWRGFDLLIEAFGQAVSKKRNIYLEIVGEGIEKKRLQNLIKKCNISPFAILSGRVTKEIYTKKVQEADIIINPTLKEGGVTVAFDAMKMGKPLICIETKGYTRCFNEEYAIVLKKSKRAKLVEELADAIIKMSDKDTRATMGEKAKKVSEKYSWGEKSKIVNNLIQNNYDKYKMEMKEKE